MKQVSRLLMGGALLCGLWSCSSDNTPDNPGNNPVFEGTGYLAVQVKLPQVPATKANDKFDDGEGYEYNVADCHLLLFKGSTEANSTFIGGYELKNAFKTNTPDNDNITSSDIIATQVDELSLSATDKLWGLVLVNKPSSLSWKNAQGENAASISIGSSSITTFSGLLTQTSKEDFYNVGDSKFFMTNAVLSKTIGGSTNPGTPEIFTLVDLSSNLYSTKEEAEKNPAGCIYVERAVAKVTATLTSNEVTIGTTEYTVEVSYALDNLEPSSYYIRNVVDAAPDSYFAWDLANTSASIDKYRMIGSVGMPGLSNPLHEVDQYFYRTYWCKDPHYSTKLNTVTEAQTELDRPNPTFVGIYKENNKTQNPLYCHENTFSTTNQTYDNTSRVILKVKFTTKKDGTAATFYVRNEDKTKLFTNVADVESYGRKEITDYAGIAAALKSAMKSGAPEGTVNATKFLTIAYSDDTEGNHKISSITLNTGAENFDTYFDDSSAAKFDGSAGKNYAQNADVIKNIMDMANSKNRILKYENGESYYSVMVKHFADDGCPLPADWNGTTTSEVYGSEPDASTNYLGRYGMVRNNWYDLSITEIQGVGDPVIPKLEINLSDDNKKEKKWIAVEIHTLSWAKRTQGVILGQ